MAQAVSLTNVTDRDKEPRILLELFFEGLALKPAFSIADPDKEKSKILILSFSPATATL